MTGQGTSGSGQGASAVLTQIEAAHDELIRRTGATEQQRQGLREVRDGLTSSVSALSNDLLAKRPAPDEWSILENLEHVRDHDRRYVEIETRGLDHYVDHGNDHVAQVARARDALMMDEPGQTGG